MDFNKKILLFLIASALVWVSKPAQAELCLALLTYTDKPERVIADIDSHKAFFKAIKNGQIEVVNQFLEDGIDVNLKNPREHTPLILASMGGHTEMVELFLKYEEIDVNIQSFLGKYTALILALRNGHDAIVELLLKHKNIKVNIKDSFGQTALMEAAFYGYIEITELLLKHKGIGVNDKNDFGETALTIALARGRDAIAKELRRESQKLKRKPSTNSLN